MPVSTPTNSQPDATDLELVGAFLHGREAAFKELVGRHQQGLYGFVWRQVRNHADTADICQKVFLSVFQKAGGFRGEASFRTWLYQLALNQCRNAHREKARARISDTEVSIDDLQVDEHTAEDEMESTQMRTQMRRVVDSLPPKQRQTLELKFYQDLTFKEVAAVMGCPEGTAKANYHHAMTALRSKLRGETP